jgi:hypothetical protein
VKSDYEKHLKAHLADYKRRHLGVEADGIWTKNGQTYPHILPSDSYAQNLLAPIRAELLGFLEQPKSIKRHTDFHHLNSSQAFALNLFFPYAAEGETSGRTMADAFGLPDRLARVEFEVILDEQERTNIDVVLTSQGGVRTFCEVKLSESEFGSAKADARHRKKLENIYAPHLQGIVQPSLLEEATFFRDYQILRNLWLLHGDASTRLAFLLPAANAPLAAQLERVLAGVTSTYRARVHVIFVEQLLLRLQDDPDAAPALRSHAPAVEEKYVPPAMRVATGAR